MVWPMLLTGKMENKMPNIEKVKTVIGKPYDEVTKFLVDKSYHFILCKTEPNAEPEIFQWDKEENRFYNLNGYIRKSYFENHWLYLGQVMCPNLVDPFKFMIDTKEKSFIDWLLDFYDPSYRSRYFVSEPVTNFGESNVTYTIYFRKPYWNSLIMSDGLVISNWSAVNEDGDSLTLNVTPLVDFLKGICKTLGVKCITFEGVESKTTIKLLKINGFNPVEGTGIDGELMNYRLDI